MKQIITLTLIAVSVYLYTDFSETLTNIKQSTEQPVILANGFSSPKLIKKEVKPKVKVSVKKQHAELTDTTDTYFFATNLDRANTILSDAQSKGIWDEESVIEIRGIYSKMSERERSKWKKAFVQKLVSGQIVLDDPQNLLF